MRADESVRPAQASDILAASSVAAEPLVNWSLGNQLQGQDHWRPPSPKVTIRANWSEVDTLLLVFDHVVVSVSVDLEVAHRDALAQYVAIGNWSSGRNH